MKRAFGSGLMLGVLLIALLGTTMTSGGASRNATYLTATSQGSVLPSSRQISCGFRACTDGGAGSTLSLTGMAQSFPGTSTQVIVGNTTTESSIMAAAITPPASAANGLLRLKTVMNVTVNSTLCTTLTMRFKLGATTLATRTFTTSDGAVNIGSNVPYIIDAEILLSSISSQTIYTTGTDFEIVAGASTFKTLPNQRATAAASLPALLDVTLQWNSAQSTCTATADQVSVLVLANG